VCSRFYSATRSTGIFAEVPITAQAAPKAHASYSSIEGGIFGGPASRPITPRESITKSGIEGGVFGGQPVNAENELPRARAKTPVVAKEHTAGVATRKEMGVAPAPPLNSARSDPNRSSIQGGIFGAGSMAPPSPRVRSNPNQSSIQGGIFG